MRRPYAYGLLQGYSKLDYTQEEVRVLKEILAAITGNGRTSFTADQRCRLAVAGKALSPEERKKCCQIVNPGTILGWFRQLAARKYDSSESKVGRPRKKRDIRKLVVEMALANLRRWPASWRQRESSLRRSERRSARGNDS